MKGVPNVDAVVILMYLNRLSEVRNQLDELSTKDAYPEFLHFESYQLAFLHGDTAAMSREIEWAAGKKFVETGFLSLEADTAAYFGKFSKAREYSRRAMQSAKLNKEVGWAWSAVANQVLREVLVGNIAEGRRAEAPFDDFAPLSQKPLALALAFAGETTKPNHFAEELGKKELRATLDFWLPSIRAQVWLNQQKPEKAVELLKSVEPFRLIYHEAAYATYIQAYANLAVPHIDAARTDFQEILDHRGAVGNSLVGALAHIGFD